MFCAESTASWHVAMVTASENATTPGAFGTQGKSQNLYRDTDTSVPGCMAR